MNALTKIEPALDPFATWVEEGANLLAKRRDLDWQLADHLAQGMDRFPDRVQLSFLGEQWGVEQKFLGGAINAVKAFPASHRDTALTLEHHIHAAALPPQERLPMLKAAHEEHWTARQMRIQVIERRGELGERVRLDDEDRDYHQLMACVRAWNTAGRSVREEFLEMANAAKLGDVEA